MDATQMAHPPSGELRTFKKDMFDCQMCIAASTERSVVASHLCDVLSLEDFYLRHEYQCRGSLHTHGVGYLREGKDVTEVVRLPETFPDRLAEYVDGLVTAWHQAPPVPGQPFVPPVPHPCAKRFEDVDDFGPTTSRS